MQSEAEQTEPSKEDMPQPPSESSTTKEVASAATAITINANANANANASTNSNASNNANANANTNNSNSKNKSSKIASPRKRTRSEDDGSEEPPLPPAHAPVITSDGMVEFSLAAVHEYLICGLCSGYYKDPYTITDCLHTFCKSCLFYSVACGCHECPECKVYLGSDPLKVAVLDHCLQDLVDRIVFPEFLAQEQQEEREFYAARGIAMKPELTLKGQAKRRGTASTHHASTKRHDELEFTLMPERAFKGDSLPPLDRPCLRISGKFRMNQVKKYIIRKLDLSSVSQPALDILCNGVPLGDEISLSFVKRLLWHHDYDLALTYRIADDVC